MSNEKIEKKENAFYRFGGGDGCNIFTYPVHSHDHVIYIDDMEYLEDHQTRLQTIRQATPDDTVRIIINSPGGVISIAMAYVSAIRECQASVIAHAEGNVCSAGTILWLACKDRTVSPLTEFMFHNYQGGARGDGANMYSQIVFYKNYFDRLVKEFYTDVLTEVEIGTINGGGQVWMDEVEILKRVDAVLLDERNIKRFQQGQRPITSKEQMQKAANKPVKNAAEQSVPEKDVVLRIALHDEEFKFDLAKVVKEDFDGFNVEELQCILGAIGAVAEGKDTPLEVSIRNRQDLLDLILAYAGDILDNIKEQMEG